MKEKDKCIFVDSKNRKDRDVQAQEELSQKRILH